MHRESLIRNKETTHSLCLLNRYQYPILDERQWPCQDVNRRILEQSNVMVRRMIRSHRRDFRTYHLYVYIHIYICFIQLLVNTTKNRLWQRKVSFCHDDKFCWLDLFFLELAVQTSSESETVDPTSLVSSTVTDDEPREAVIKCDSCQATFLTSEQFSQHRLYHCSFLPG